jgi:Ser/Thr protein kinase RdoA (MazF antagonist)
MDDLAEKIFKAYGLRPIRILPPQKGYRNTSLAAKLPDTTWVNAIIYKDEPGILETIRLSNTSGNYLAGKGLPARRQIDPRIITLRNQEREIIRYAALYDYLPGETIPWEAYTMDRLKELGKTLSMMHYSFKNMNSADLPKVRDVYAGHLERMMAYFSDPGVKSAMRRKLEIAPPLEASSRLLRFLRLCGQLPDQQALHMDFVRGNVLFKGDKITGILDFEKTAYGHPLFDVARTLAFLLIDCKYKSPDKVQKYFLYSGYAKRGPATLRKIHWTSPALHIDMLEQLVNLFLLHDFYKFLRHNPYKSLQDNEHFTRTKDLMRKRGLIHPTS